MIAWVHSFRKWTWLTFAIGFAAAVWGLWSEGGHSLLVRSGLTAMIGVAMIVGARRWRRRNRLVSACGDAPADDCDPPGRQDGSDDATFSGKTLAAPAEGSPVCRIQEFVDALMSEGRYALVLRPQIAGNLSPNLLALARQRLERQMTLVPEGDVLLEPHLAAEEPSNEAEAIAAGGTVVRVAATFLDRYTVTNRQFQLFVKAGGYDQIAIWDPTIWPAVLDFVQRHGPPRSTILAARVFSAGQSRSSGRGRLLA